jgi:hypothetical protein
MTAEAKIRNLARQDATLQSYFLGTNGTFRWFDMQEQPGYIGQGTCARVLRVSTLFMQTHETQQYRSLNQMQQPRFQIDVLDYDSERARSAAAAIIDWLARVDFSSDAQFASPVTSPTRHPHQILNQRSGMIPQTQPPVWVQSIDVRITDLQE